MKPSITKQESLLNFFQKGITKKSTVNTMNNNKRQHEEISKLEDIRQQQQQQLIFAEKCGQINKSNQNIEQEDDYDNHTSPAKLFKRLKRTVKIDDDDDDNNNNNVENKVNNNLIQQNIPLNEKKIQPATTVYIGQITNSNLMNQLDGYKKSITLNSSSSNNKPSKQEIENHGNINDHTPKTKGRKSEANKQQTTDTKETKSKSKKTITTPNKEIEDDVYIDIAKNEQNAIDINDFTDKTPDWALEENHLDANGKRPGEESYDPTTLLIPKNVLDGLTSTMKQYWLLKAQNYDKILLFKLGKFYELFYNDALICHKELDLNWMGNKMHVGFPEKALERMAYTLVSRGYKVCVVEQTETPKQMEERIKYQKSGKKEKTINRELVQVLSKGTYIDYTQPAHEPKYLLSIRNDRKKNIAICFVDATTNIITTGVINDDANYTHFKTLISQIRPSEVIYEELDVDKNLLPILKNSIVIPVISCLNAIRDWSPAIMTSELEKYYPNEKPNGIKKLYQHHDENQKLLMYSAFSGLISYLTKLLIVDKILGTARFEFYDMNNIQQTYMVLDSQALQHLEILEVGYSTKNPNEGSLLWYLDKTITQYGKRLIKKWICYPLLNIEHINDRLDAIEDLQQVSGLRDKLRTQISKLPDLERLCTKIYSQSIRKKEKAVLFEDISTTRLKEFSNLLMNLVQACDIIKSTLGEQTSNYKSKLLRNLTTLIDVRQKKDERTFFNNPTMLPDVAPIINDLSSHIIWGGPRNEIPTPKPGIDKDYDSIKAEIGMIEKKLNQYLEEIQAKFNDRAKAIKYAHTKHRYELEIPERFVEGSKKPPELEFTSKKAGVQRFHTKQIKDLVYELEDAEERLKGALGVFASFIFRLFHQYSYIWDQFVSCLAQLDCLCSLSLTSFNSDGVMCRPEVFPPNDRVFMEIKEMRHPCIVMTGISFIPNDIILGETEDNDSDNTNHIMLLTGPNMGGKSTILRQTCIAAILAQIGCYIPATECRLSIIDRIFTRIGASDKLMEGKSTFYIEMEETFNIVQYGTRNSLAILDELGRGTSTFDGVAIAYSVLKYLQNHVKCMALFATHYHVLLEEFRNNKEIEYYHMAADIDEKNEKVIFLYKLTPGECSNSFGINIARVAGIPKEIIFSAKEKAIEFEKNLNLRTKVKLCKQFANITEKLQFFETIADDDELIDDNINPLINDLINELKI